MSPEFAFELLSRALAPPREALAVLATLVALAGFARGAWHDFRTYEIHPESLTVAVLATAALLVAQGGPDALASNLLFALFAAGAVAAFRRLGSPIGWGDLWLLGALGLVAGSEGAIAVYATLAAAAGATTAAKAAIRRRPFWRTPVPMAVPALFAAATGLLLRTLDVAAAAVPGGNTAPASAALFLAAALVAPLLWERPARIARARVDAPANASSGNAPARGGRT